MMKPLLPLNPGAGPAVTPSVKPTSESDAATSNAFEKLLSRANNEQILSDKAIEDLVTGKSDDVQQVVMQVVKAEMSFQLFMEIRNQMIESYNDLMRMQF